MKKILVFNVNWIGDVIFSAPIFNALSKKYPGAEIVCLAVPRVQSILKMIPGIDRIMVYDEERKHRFLLGKIKLVLQLRREKFDIAFVIHGSLTRALLIFLSGIPHRIGYATKRRRFFLTQVVEPSSKILHRSDYYLRIVESFSINVRDRQCRLVVDPEDIRWAENYLQENNIKQNDFFVVLNPGGNWSLKRWPKESFAKLAQQLISRFQAKVGICGSLADVEISRYMKKVCQDHIYCLFGKTTLGQLAAVFQKASLVISADSGPMHIASGVGTKVIALFGPTHPEVTGPRGQSSDIILRYEVGCNKDPCYHLKCQDNICMKSINIKDVLQVI